jgi:putative acetyltransferase
MFKQYDENSVEIKRMFVRLEYRNRKIAGLILQELESWSIEKGFSKFILETGPNQPQAVALYQSYGYRRIENFG